MYSRRNESFAKVHPFSSCESQQCMNYSPLGFATGPSLNRTDRQPIRSIHDANNYRQQQILNGQYITISVNGASTICGLVSTVIHQ